MSNTMEEKKGSATDDDLEYVRACQKGDAEAFSVLVSRHSGKILNIVYRMLAEYDEACDVTQEVFLAAFRSIGKFKAEAKFSTWLYRIAVNYTKNRLRQRRNLSRHESVFLDDVADIQGACAACSASSDAGHPGEHMERRELNAAVEKCISGLDGDYREVLVLRDIQGFSYEEIKTVLRIPDGTVKSRLSRARLAMKHCLEKVIGNL